MRVNVVTPWYPDYASSYSGVFVRQQVDALRSLGAQVFVEVPLVYPAPSGPVPQQVKVAMRRLAESGADNLFPSDGSTTWIPSPVPSKSGYAGRTKSFASSISLKREFQPVEVDVFHAHLGVPTGAALDEIGDRPLFVTEHQSTLSTIFTEPQARDLYGKTIESSNGFFCVSTALRDQIVDALGSEAGDRIEIVPNIVNLSDIEFVARTRYQFSRWIYIGTIAAHKGIETLMKAFKSYRQRYDRSASLTLVGQGPHVAWTEKFISANGLRSAVHLAGSKPHQEIGPFMVDADVMVHLSESETFGIASLEGIGSGLPVVSLKNGGADSSWGDMERECGLLLELGTTPDQIADAVAGLADGHEGLDLQTGRKMVESRFGPTIIANRLMTAYETSLR